MKKIIINGFCHSNEKQLKCITEYKLALTKWRKREISCISSLQYRYRYRYRYRYITFEINNKM